MNSWKSTVCHNFIGILDLKSKNQDYWRSSTIIFGSVGEIWVVGYLTVTNHCITLFHIFHKCIVRITQEKYFNRMKYIWLNKNSCTGGEIFSCIKNLFNRTNTSSIYLTVHPNCYKYPFKKVNTIILTNVSSWYTYRT